MSILQVYFVNVFILQSLSKGQQQLKEKLKDVLFNVHTIEPPYAFKVSFSRVNLHVCETIVPSFSFVSLFSLDEVEQCPTIRWERQKSKDLFIDVMENVFAKLGEVTLEPTYKSKVVSDAFIPEIDSQDSTPTKYPNPISVAA